MKPRRVVLGLVQSAPVADPAENLRRGLALAARAAAKGARIVCLPELYRSRYFPQSRNAKAARLAEAIPGESTRAFADLARRTGAVMIVPLFEKVRGRFFNSAAVIDADGRLLGA